MRKAPRNSWGPFEIVGLALLMGEVPENVQDQHKQHERDAGDQRYLRHDVIEAGLTLKAGPDSAAARHGVSLTGNENQ